MNILPDHELTRSGLRFLPEEQSNWTVCGEVSNGRMAVEMAEKLTPDFAILGVSMPGLNGLEATRQIRKSQPRTRILIYSMHETEKIILDALEVGARGLVLKSDAEESMVAAVQSIAAGRRFFTSSVVDAYLSKCDAGRQEAGTLTNRENEVAQLVAEGKSNKEVAGILFITDRTVEGHRRETMRKLELGSIAVLVLYTVRNGIIQP